MTLYVTRFESPVGVLQLKASDTALVAIEFDGAGDAGDDFDHPLLARARAELDEYFAGRREVFDVPLAVEGSEWEERVWRALRAIPFGETISYGELARRVDR